MWKRLKSRYWDVETMVLGAPELYIIHHKVPFLYDLLRFAVTVLLLGVIILWVRSGELTPTLNTPASTSSADHQ